MLTIEVHTMRFMAMSCSSTSNIGIDLRSEDTGLNKSMIAEALH